jgi:hypothetical protein
VVEGSHGGVEAVMSNSKRVVREVRLVAEGMGYVFDGLTSRGHLKWRNPAGKLVITGSHLSNARSMKNAVAQLRHAAQDAREDIKP